MVLPDKVTSAYGDIRNADDGIGMSASLMASKRATARPPPADSPERAILLGGTPWLSPDPPINS
jgi:hypothetical protein